MVLGVGERVVLGRTGLKTGRYTGAQAASEGGR